MADETKNDEQTPEEEQASSQEKSEESTSASEPTSETSAGQEANTEAEPEASAGGGAGGGDGGGGGDDDGDGDDAATPAPQPAFGGGEARTYRRDITIISSVVGIAVIISLIQFFFGGTDHGLNWFALRAGLGAVATLVIFSFLYRENPLYRFFEHILVGLGVGYGVGQGFVLIFLPNFVEKVIGADAQPANLWWLLCLIPGSMWYFQLSRKHVWLSRLTIAFFLGNGSGLALKTLYNVLIRSDGKGQLLDSFRNFLNFHGAQELIPKLNEAGQMVGYQMTEVGFWSSPTWTSINNLLFVVIVVAVLSYFFFSFRHDKVPGLATSAKVGRYFLMVSFGAIFGGAVMGRMALLINRLVFLVFEWLKF